VAYEDGQLPFLEVLQDAKPPLLVHITGDHPAGETIDVQPVAQKFRFPLGINEDHGPGHSLPAQKSQKKRKLLLAGHMIKDLLYPLRGHLLRSGGNLFRQVHEFVGQFHHPLVEGGGKHHVLPLVKGGEAPKDKAEVRDETHVEHSIRLVDNQRLDPLQGVNLLLQVIDESSRGADDDISALLEGVALLLVIYTSVDRLDCEAGMGAQEVRVLLNLHHQLTRWRQDECPGIALPRRPGKGKQAGKEGKEESSGLAGACLGLTCHVLAGEGDGERLFLYRGTVAESGVLDALQHLFRKIQFGKSHVQ